MTIDLRSIQHAFKERALQGLDPEDGPLSVLTSYERCNRTAKVHARVKASAEDRNWWKDPDKFKDGDEQRLHTGYPTERLAMRNLRREARLWIPTIERPMTFTEIIYAQGIQTLYEVLAEKRPAREQYEHKRRLGRPLKTLHKETGQLEPTPVILATLGLSAYVPA